MVALLPLLTACIPNFEQLAPDTTARAAPEDTTLGSAGMPAPVPNTIETARPRAFDNTEVSSSAGAGEFRVVSGEPLPAFGGDTAADLAVGLTAPTISGPTLDGGEAVVAADGRVKVLLLTSHWSPHGQREAETTSAFIARGALPEKVDFYVISTLAQPARDNWPAEDWLKEHGWTVPVIVDHNTEPMAPHAYGTQGIPFWVILDGENKVVARVPGEIGDTGREAIFSVAKEIVAGSGTENTDG